MNIVNLLTLETTNWFQSTNNKIQNTFLLLKNLLQFTDRKQKIQHEHKIRNYL